MAFASTSMAKLFRIKAVPDPSPGWDPCSVHVYAAPSWKRGSNPKAEAYLLEGSKRDGIYVNRKERNAVCIPEVTWVTVYPDLDSALFHHFVKCQREHPACFQRNIERMQIQEVPADSEVDEACEILESEIRAAEIELGIQEDDSSDDEELSEYYDDEPPAYSKEPAQCSGASGSEKAINTPPIEAYKPQSEVNESGNESTEFDELDEEEEVVAVVAQRDTPGFILDEREAIYERYLYSLATLP
ncbi:hypothetical protein C8R47DRAFT_1074145 [Mycena vitilis]|nr:hypothetical protein C8R47DRAFT_1074145 [Mycena vitilis]